MNLQAHLSGQMSSGQVPMQTDNQLSGLQQQYGNPPDNERIREFMRGKIWDFLTHKRPEGVASPQTQRLHDLVKRLEELFYKSARSLDEYTNMSTLQTRLAEAIKRIPNGNNRPLQHPNPSPSVGGTMIPTPGMHHQPGNSALAVNSTLDGSIPINNSSSSNLYPGNFMPTGNGSSGNLHGGSFSSSDGVLSGGYRQSTAFPGNSGGNNLMTSSMGGGAQSMGGGVQRMSSQMIPTPGFNNSQNNNNVNISSGNQQFINVESSNNIGAAFSTIESQPMQQQKQRTSSQNSRILHNLGGAMGGNIRSTLQQKPYGLSNGPSNGGLGGIMGNNMSLMNGPGTNDSYITGNMHGSSIKTMHPHFDQLQQPVGQGDGYGQRTDASGSGNMFVPGTSVGSMMNNQSLNAVSQSMQKINPSLMANQSSRQLANMKPQSNDQVDKINFQSQYSVKENLLQPHQPPSFQQPSNQFQRQQLIQLQAQQKLQNQNQNQNHNHLLLKSDSFSQSQQMSSNFASDGLQSQSSNPFQFSHMQNQFQQNSMEENSRATQLHSHPVRTQDIGSALNQTSEQVQKLLHMKSEPFAATTQNDFHGLSHGTELDATFQGQWNSQSQNVSNNASGRHPQVQNMQSEFNHQLTAQQTAQPNNLSSEESMIGEQDASKSAYPPATNNAVCGSSNPDRGVEYRLQIKWLMFLRHARYCSFPEGQCLERNCTQAQKLVKHISFCKESQCAYPRCHGSKNLISHLKSCQDSSCPVCIPYRNYCHKFAKITRPEPKSLPGPVDVPSKFYDTTDVGGRSIQKTSPVAAETTEDLLQPSKRLKIEQGSQSLISGSQSAAPLLSAVPEPPLVNTRSVREPHGSHIPTKPESVEVKMEVPGSVVQPFPKIPKMKSDNLDHDNVRKSEGDSSRSTIPSGFGVQEVIKIEEETAQANKTESAAVPVETASKSGKPKIKGVSMTELFTPEQVREHIKGLRQWVGQSKAKAEKNQATAMNENSCQLCAVEKLTFEPPPLYCTHCGARIKRNAMYYTIGGGETRHYFCIPCYNEARGDIIVVEGTPVSKSKMDKKKNDEETEEWWVQCDKCEAWQHQICTLFNGRRNDGEAEYTCPNCYVEEVERGERMPLPESAVLGAKDLPRTVLSDHMEQRLFGKLRQERLDRARAQGKHYDEVPGADSLVVRVVSSVDKKLDVKPRFLEIFQDENYPLEYPYKSKVVLLFQKIEGVEVCLFGMYVQEFGSECQQPNHRRVYLSYLDSVKYFRPDVRAVTGEALRTFVYHEILIGYLEYCKMRGFTSCYIWACPPLKGEDYILYCHPEIQKTPKSDKLREWYLAMLRKATKENIVVELTNLYDHFFTSSGESRAKITAARLPYFDGDYWPGAAEDMISQLQQEEDGRKQYKKGTMKKTLTKRALKASGQTDLSGNATKDLMLMHRLGDTISPMKEDFIMVHLQHACTHCCILMVSGNRWVCKICKKFQLCDRCYDAERKRDDRERHPMHHKDKHPLYPVEIVGVPEITIDKDEILESEFFDTRQAFLSLCQGNHYQYDTLRRAKHSSMMVLYHLHNPTAPAFVMTCNICTLDIETGQGWRCETCPDYDVCNNCYQKDGGVNHPHKLTNHPSADRDAQNKEARQMRVQQLAKMLELLVHASQCRSPSCAYPNCRKVKGLFRHGMGCKTRASGGCVLCKKMWYLLQLHARSCKQSECAVPRCKDLKEHMRRLQQQSDSRRRAAVMEMMRNRALEVAGSS